MFFFFYIHRQEVDEQLLHDIWSRVYTSVIAKKKKKTKTSNLLACATAAPPLVAQQPDENDNTFSETYSARDEGYRNARGPAADDSAARTIYA